MYFDPGTGSMIIQIIIAGIASIGALAFTFRNAIVNFFKKGKNKDESGEVDK